MQCLFPGVAVLLAGISGLSRNSSLLKIAEHPVMCRLFLGWPKTSGLGISGAELW